MIPVIVLNLLRDTDRRTWMDGHLRSLGIPYTLAHGIDGRTIPDDEVARHRATFRRGYIRDMTRGELGCALAHLGLFRRIAAGPDPFVCTMEDDIEISTAVLAFLEETTLRLLPPFDVLRLFATGERRHRAAWKVAAAHRHSVVVPLRAGWGMHAQVITRAGAAKLAGWPITAPIDGIYHDYPPRGLRIMEIRPSLIRRLDFGSNTLVGLMRPAKKTYWYRLRAEGYRTKRLLRTRMHFVRTWGLRGLYGLVRSRHHVP